VWGRSFHRLAIRFLCITKTQAASSMKTWTISIRCIRMFRQFRSSSSSWILTSAALRDERCQFNCEARFALVAFLVSDLHTIQRICLSLTFVFSSLLYMFTTLGCSMFVGFFLWMVFRMGTRYKACARGKPYFIYVLMSFGVLLTYVEVKFRPWAPSIQVTQPFRYCKLWPGIVFMILAWRRPTRPAILGIEQKHYRFDDHIVPKTFYWLKVWRLIDNHLLFIWCNHFAR